MTNHRMEEQKRPKGEETTPIKAPKNATLEQLRGKHKNSGQGGLSAQEAKSMILLGNKNHQEKLADSGTPPQRRYEKIMDGEADYVIIFCSDARNATLDSEQDGEKLVGVHIRIAGNVIPFEGVSLDEIKDVISKLKPDGDLIIMAHCKCGAVGEHVKWNQAGQPDTGSEPLNALLHAVFGETPQENAMAQYETLKSLVGPDRKITVMMYDWEDGSVEILSPEASETARLLKSKLERFHQEADSDGKLGERLSETQKPHTTVVASNLMPFSIDTVCDAEQNELFATTGSEGGLDHYDEASALYAAEHLGPKHIAFIAPMAAGMEKMFDRWEADLRSMPQVAEKLDSGAIKITRLGYNLSNGALQEV